MNKLTLLLAGVALVASSLSAAAAETIPAKYRGEWCDHGAYFLPYHRNLCKRGGLGYMRITATNYELEMEDVERCRIISLKTDSYPRADGTMTADHLITFICNIDGAERPLSLTSRFGTSPGRMGRGIRLYIEPLDSDQKNQ